MKKVLIINGHSNIEQSHANKVILEETKKLLPEAEIRNLSQLYPDFQINVEEEQKFLEQADVIVWQFPTYWYSLPALLKKWLDDVFSYGFAYGPAYKLEGKKFLISLTTGSPEEVYQKGENSYPFEDFLYIHRQTANFTKMEFVEPAISYGMMYLAGVMPEEVLPQVQQKAKEHAERLVEQIKGL